MSAAILEQVMQKYGCTTIEELREKHQEFDRCANVLADMVVSASGKGDYQRIHELKSTMDENSIKLSEIERALRTLEGL